MTPQNWRQQAASPGAHCWGDEDWSMSEPGLKVDYAKWNFREWPKLDLDKASSFMPWWNRARRWLKDGRPCMERLLLLLEREVEPIAAWQEETVKRAARLPDHWDGAQVSREISDALVRTGTDGVAEKAREFGDTCGFELYRWIHARFKGIGPEQGQAAFQKVTNPVRCRSTQELRDSLTQMAKDIRDCEAYGPDFAISQPQRTLALEARLPPDLLRELQNQMFSTYEQKYRFVQNRVELDHTRRLNSQTGIARLERPGSLFDGGYDAAFGEADDDGDGPEVGSEAVAPLVASLVALQAMPDATGALGPTIAEIKRKIGKAKGGGKGGGVRAPGRQAG